MKDRSYYTIDHFGQIQPKWKRALFKGVRAIYVRIRWGILMVFSSKTRKHHKFISYWNANLERINKLRRLDTSIHRDYYWCNFGIIEQEVKMFIMIGNAYDFDLLVHDRHMNQLQSDFLKEILFYLKIPMEKPVIKYIAALDKAYPDNDRAVNLDG